MIEVTKSFSETPYHSDLRTKPVFSTHPMANIRSSAFIPRATRYPRVAVRL